MCLKKTLISLTISVPILAATIQSKGSAQVKEMIALRPIGDVDEKLLVHLKEQLGLEA